MPKAKNRGPQTKAKRKYNDKAYDTIRFTVTKGHRDIIKEHAANQGLSVSAYIKEVLYKRLEEENNLMNTNSDNEDE